MKTSSIELFVKASASFPWVASSSKGDLGSCGKVYSTLTLNHVMYVMSYELQNFKRNGRKDGLDTDNNSPRASRHVIGKYDLHKTGVLEVSCGWLGGAFGVNWGSKTASLTYWQRWIPIGVCC